MKSFRRSPSAFTAEAGAQEGEGSQQQRWQRLETSYRAYYWSHEDWLALLRVSELVARRLEEAGPKIDFSGLVRARINAEGGAEVLYGWRSRAGEPDTPVTPDLEQAAVSFSYRPLPMASPLAGCHTEEEGDRKEAREQAGKELDLSAASLFLDLCRRRFQQGGDLADPALLALLQSELEIALPRLGADQRSEAQRLLITAHLLSCCWLLDLTHFAEAAAHGRQALRLAHDLDDVLAQAAAYLRLGQILREAGSPEESLTCLAKARSLSNRAPTSLRARVLLDYALSLAPLAQHWSQRQQTLDLLTQAATLVVSSADSVSESDGGYLLIGCGREWHRLARAQVFLELGRALEARQELARLQPVTLDRRARLSFCLLHAEYTFLCERYDDCLTWLVEALPEVQALHSVRAFRCIQRLYKRLQATPFAGKDRLLRLGYRLKQIIV